MGNRKKNRRIAARIFIKRRYQLSIIVKIVSVMLVTGLLTVLFISLFYNNKSQMGSFYYMAKDMKQDLELTNILGIILPAVAIAQVAGVIIAVFIGIFSSRKAAIPIYKIEKWASELKSGNLNTRLAFREVEQMRELTSQCNGVTTFFAETFHQIDDIVSEGKQQPEQSGESAQAALEKIANVLKKIQY